MVTLACYFFSVSVFLVFYNRVLLFGVFVSMSLESPLSCGFRVGSRR